MSIRADAAAKSDSHYPRWLQPTTLDSVRSMQVGDKVILRHGSVEYAVLLKKHGYPPLRAFRVVEVMPEYNALRVDTRGTGIQPVVKMTSCARALKDSRIFDDLSLNAGYAESRNEGGYNVNQ
eukprot:5457559-Pleurochrysis_carterae.AAC.1